MSTVHSMDATTRPRKPRSSPAMPKAIDSPTADMHSSPSSPPTSPQPLSSLTVSGVSVGGHRAPGMPAAHDTLQSHPAEQSFRVSSQQPDSIIVRHQARKPSALNLSATTGQPTHQQRGPRRHTMSISMPRVLPSPSVQQPHRAPCAGGLINFPRLCHSPSLDSQSSNAAEDSPSVESTVTDVAQRSATYQIVNVVNGVRRPHRRSVNSPENAAPGIERCRHRSLDRSWPLRSTERDVENGDERDYDSNAGRHASQINGEKRQRQLHYVNSLPRGMIPSTSYALLQGGVKELASGRADHNSEDSDDDDDGGWC